MTGGCKECNQSDDTSRPITGCDVTVMVELGMIIMSCDVLYTQ